MILILNLNELIEKDIVSDNFSTMKTQLICEEIEGKIAPHLPTATEYLIIEEDDDIYHWSFDLTTRQLMGVSSYDINELRKGENLA